MEHIYRFYFSLTAIRPLGAIDWSIRRTLGRLFNGAARKPEVRAIRQMASRRGDGLGGWALVKRIPDDALPRVVLVVAAKQNGQGVRTCVESLLDQDYAAGRLALWLCAHAESVEPWITQLQAQGRVELRGEDLDTAARAAACAPDVRFVLTGYTPAIAAPGLLRSAVEFATAQPDDIAAWDLSPALSEREDYVDPVTLEAGESARRFVLLRAEAVRQGSFTSGGDGGGAREAASTAVVQNRHARIQCIGRTADFHTPTGENASSMPVCDAPVVSIIIRTYAGRGDWLRQSISSVLNQTYPGLELLVVEDGSDEFAPLVAGLAAAAQPGRDIRHLNQPKLGKACAGNLGLENCTGELIGFLDDDDLLLPAHVELLYNAWRLQPGAAAAYGLAWEAHTPGNGGAPLEGVHFEVPPHMRGDFDRKKLSQVNFLPIQSVLFHRSCYEQAGGFDPGREFLEDWALWDHYAAVGPFVHLPRVTSLFRTPADPYERIARVRRLERRALPERRP
jgi:hypothetical protein